jgi:hypothetical protein
MNGTALVGWRPSPNERGTIDLIWSCLLVIFTAVWTVIHLNLPAKNDGLRTVLVRQMRWIIFAILAPDMVTLYSGAHWVSAKRSVLQMLSLGHKNWTLEHAFYADSGGFWLDSTDYPSFPVKASSIYYLVKENYIPCPSMTKEEIWDKSKADKFAKGFALVQSGWLVLQSITRAVEGLPISQLELFTLSFVISTIMSYFFWLHKPQHVAVPTTLQFDSNRGTMATVLRKAGADAAELFTDTPLDFIEKPLQIWKRRRMLQCFDLQERPLQRIPNDAITPGGMNWLEFMLVLVPSMIHSAIHLIGWNFHFPTRIEQYLWRAASLVLAGGLPVSVGVELLLQSIGFRGQPSFLWIWVKPELKEKGWRYRAIDVWAVFVVCCMVLARLCLIGEVLASLRVLPEGVYRTVDWTGFIPHV